MYAKYDREFRRFAFSTDDNGGVEISDERHSTLIDGQASGKIISSDADGKPILIDPAKASAAQVVMAIKAERDRRQLEGGVKVGGRWFLSTERATSEYNSLLNVAVGLDQTAVLRNGWRTMDGATVDMTPALARQILVAGIAQRCAIDDAAQVHIAAVNLSTDPADYDFSAGWPEIFSPVA